MTMPVNISWQQAETICMDAARRYLEQHPAAIQCLPGEQALGRTLAKDVCAERRLPAWDTSIMDGIAIAGSQGHNDEPLGPWQLRSESAAGHPESQVLPTGHADRISTGAVLPPGADTVIRREDLKFDTARQRVALAPDDAIKVETGQNVRPAGSDIELGQLAVTAGTLLDPGAIALATALGHTELQLIEPPKLSIVSTGDELRAPGSELNRGQIISTNAVMLGQQAQLHGTRAPLQIHAEDSLSTTIEAIDAASRKSDLVLTSGGISVGDHDHVAAALESLGYRKLFHRVQIRPGRPLVLAEADRPERGLVLALPGNPASSLVCFELFASVIIRTLLGQGERTLRAIYSEYELATALPAQPRRTHFVRARILGGRVQPLGRQLSGALTSIADYDALIEQPPDTPLAAGSRVRARLKLGPR